jgi:hypothetical protein
LPFKNEQLNINIKLTINKALITSATLGICGKCQSLESVRPAKQGYSHHWQFSNAYTGLSLGFKTTVTSDYITKLCRKQAEVIQNHENGHVRSIGHGEASQWGLNLAAVKLMTVQVNKVPLLHRLV